MTNAEYEQAKTWFRDLLQSHLPDESSRSEWTQWFSHSCSDLELSEDTVSIYSSVSMPRKRGISFHMHRAGMDAFDAFAKESLWPECIDYLTIISGTTPRAAERIRSLLRIWISSGIGVEEMNGKIDRLLGVQPEEVERRAEIFRRQREYEEGMR